MKNILVIVLRLFALWIGISPIAYGVDNDRFKKRLESLGKAEGVYREWTLAMKSATDEAFGVFGCISHLPEIDSLWDKEDKFQREVSKQLLARVKAFNVDDLPSWQEALLSATGRQQTKAETLILIIQQEQLFNNADLKNKKAEAFRKRLKTVPQEATWVWAGVTKQERNISLFDQNRAAFHLITLDPIFEKDSFHEKSFKKLCDEEKARKK